MADLDLFEKALKEAKVGTTVIVNNNVAYGYAFAQAQSRAILLNCNVDHLPDKENHIFRFVKRA